MTATAAGGDSLHFHLPCVCVISVYVFFFLLFSRLEEKQVVLLLMYGSFLALV